MCVGAFFAFMPLAHSALVEVGDLNIINDAGNPSDGLRYLDMTYSDGLTQAAALANAQATYANARLATASEFDDLFAASAIMYDGALTASDGFLIGASAFLSTGMKYDAGALRSVLGHTQVQGPGNESTNIWTIPDSNDSTTTTRDFVRLSPITASANQFGSSPPHADLGWLIVTPVPLPSAMLLFGSGLLGLVGWRWWSTKTNVTHSPYRWFTRASCPHG